jgi:hypothetical protein
MYSSFSVIPIGCTGIASMKVNDFDKGLEVKVDFTTLVNLKRVTMLNAIVQVRRIYNKEFGNVSIELL